MEPDISVVCDKNKLNDKGCNGAPNWIIEIVSPGSQRMDYMIKLFKYRTSGVREYWIVDSKDETVTVYDFEHDTSCRAERDFCNECLRCVFRSTGFTLIGMI